MGPIITAVDDRFAASVLLAGGVLLRGRPEVHGRHYLPRVRTPTLMLNGKHDRLLDRRIQPAFDLLGTSPEHKDLFLAESDHIPPRADFIRETLRWLDEYLGPVRR